MKTNHITFKVVLFIFFTNLLLSCNKESVSSDTLEIHMDKSVKKTETIYNMNAQISSLYALQYAKAIDPEFKLIPNSPKEPRFISGKDAMSYVNLDKLPIKKEEILFIKEILHKEESRAVLIQDVEDTKNQTKVNVLYIPYPTGVNVPKDYVFQNGVLIDDWQAFYLPPIEWASLGMDGTASYCGCLITLRNFNTICSACPDLTINMLTVFEEYLEDKDIKKYESILNKYIAIEQVPIGKSLFSL